MAKPDSVEIHVLIHALREPLNALTGDVAMLESASLPPSVEPIAKSNRASMDQVLIALAGIQAALENESAKPRRRPRRR